MSKQRLDRLVVERGLAPSRALAQRLIGAGEVLVDGELVDKPGSQVGPDAVITLTTKPRYASRGGEKLAAALEHFPVTVADTVAADIGASTGGFTDCLLQHGARRVYAIDVGSLYRSLCLMYPSSRLALSMRPRWIGLEMAETWSRSSSHSSRRGESELARWGGARFRSPPADP